MTRNQKHIYRIVRNTLRFLFKCFLHVRVEKPQYNFAGPKVYAVNHPTEIDLFPVFIFVNDFVHTMVNPHIFDLPVIGTLLRMTGQIKIHRDGKKDSTMDLAHDALEKGDAVLIAPQGQRVKFGERPRPKRGVVRLALENRVPIIPVGIGIPSHKIRVNRIFYKKENRFREAYYPRFRAPYGVVFGKPITFDRFYGKKVDLETLQSLADTVMERIYGLQKRAEALISD